MLASPSPPLLSTQVRILHVPCEASYGGRTGSNSRHVIDFVSASQVAAESGLDTGAGFVAVVTGATGGIGSAITRRLATEGGSLLLTARREDALEQLVRSLSDKAHRVVTTAVDLTEDAGPIAVARKVRTFADRVDVLIHAAGSFERGTFEETETAALDALFRTNVRARYGLTRELLPLLKVASGQILFLNSSLGLRSPGGTGAYAASMHADRALADALRDEVNRERLRVTSIYLGRTATPMQERIHREEGRPYVPELLIRPETVAEAIMGVLTLTRDAEITDLAIRPMEKLMPVSTDAE